MIARILRLPFRLLDSLADRICVVAGALLASQVPGYISHYVQRLNGHVAEAQKNIASWQEIANRMTSGSLRLLISRYELSDLPEAVAAGEKCSADLVRLQTMEQALSAIREAPAWGRLFSFLRHMDPDIARAAMREYPLNIPLDFESLAYAAVGIVVAMLLYEGTKTGARHAGSAARRALAKRAAAGDGGLRRWKVGRTHTAGG
jgi:hypothetical protein